MPEALWAQLLQTWLLWWHPTQHMLGLDIRCWPFPIGPLAYWPKLPLATTQQTESTSTWILQKPSIRKETPFDNKCMKIKILIENLFRPIVLLHRTKDFFFAPKMDAFCHFVIAWKTRKHLYVARKWATYVRIFVLCKFFVDFFFFPFLMFFI